MHGDSSGNLNASHRRRTRPCVSVALYASPGVHTYTYDSESRLATAAVGGSGIATITYDYDGLGRRQKKTVNGVATQYLLDGDEEIAELDGTGAVLRRYVTASAIDDRIVAIEGGSIKDRKSTRLNSSHG